MSIFQGPNNAPIIKKQDNKNPLCNKHKKALAFNNNGLTLIELLITMTITAIVIGMVAMLIAAGSRNYSKASREIKLQMQSQIITNQLDDCLMEAYWVEEKALSSNVTAYIIYTSTIYKVIYYDKYKASIYLKSYDNLSEALNITTASYTEYEDLLSSYVTVFNLIPDETNNEVLCQITFENQSAKYSTVHTVALRNNMRRPII